MNVVGGKGSIALQTEKGRFEIGVATEIVFGITYVDKCIILRLGPIYILFSPVAMEEEYYDTEIDEEDE